MWIAYLLLAFESRRVKHSQAVTGNSINNSTWHHMYREVRASHVQRFKDNKPLPQNTANRYTETHLFVMLLFL